ncbi:MAG: hypothetical protein ACE5JZ_00490 [Kiloniellales bacterium]
MTDVPRNLVLAAAGLMLVGCTSSWATSEVWSRMGSTQEAAAANLAQCTEQADLAIRPQADINAEIVKARQAEWRANGTYDRKVQAQRNSLYAERDRLIGRCMIMRGYLIDN